MNTSGLLVCLVLTFAVSCCAFSDLKNAFDAAHMRLVANGTSLAYSSVDPYAVQVSDCFATPSFYPYPAQPSGALKSVLAKKVVVIGSVAENTLLFNATNTARPAGWAVSLLNSIFNLISANYGVQLTIQWNFFETSLAALGALKNGNVDFIGPNFALGAFWNGTRRVDTFEPTCSITGSQTNIFVKTGAFQSLAQLKAKGAQLKIATAGSGSAANAQANFPMATVTDFLTATSTNAVSDVFNAVRSGQFDASFDVDPGDVTGLTHIDSGIVATVGGFFKRDVASTPGPSTCAPTSATGSNGANTVNINFAGILSR